MQDPAIHIERLAGAELSARLPALASLRITVFREFPYLYDGSAENERQYLQTYAQASGSFIALALAGDEVIGAATALPLSAEPEYCRQAFSGHPWPESQIFYFGESVLLPAWRGRGIGHLFMQARLDHARSLGFAYAAFCAVRRPPDHPRRPSSYHTLETFWRGHGFSPLNRHCHFSWRDLDEEAPSPKIMDFWGRPL